MKKHKFLIITLSLLILATVIWGFRLDRFGFSNLKWGDYLKLKGVTYEWQYNENNERVAISEEQIGELLGTTKFKLQGKVRNPYYKMRNGDASILDSKTEIYDIKNKEYKKAIAVNIDSNYYLYNNK